MRAIWRAFAGGFRAERLQLSRARLLISLTVVQAVTFLFLVSLFGLTGSRAPTALVMLDHGDYAQQFVRSLENAHHSFALKPMREADAKAALRRGSIVAILVIPADFSEAVGRGADATLRLSVDNVNADMTEDIQRALPSAIVAFGGQVPFPGVRVHVAEQDLIARDTGFIPYLVVSGLILDAFLIAGILSALTVAREFESGTGRLLVAAPLPPLVPLAGRVSATMVVSALALMLPAAIVVWGYRVAPLHPLEAVAALGGSVVVFGCVGAALGALLKRTLPVASLVVGLSLPLYLCSGALEPQRFDGENIWALAHLSPAYPAVGILEHAFHGFRVTPESLAADWALLGGWALVMLVLSGLLLRRQLR